MNKDSYHNPFFKMHPFGVHGATAIKRGIMIYLLLAILAIPSAICSQQHFDPDFGRSDLLSLFSQDDMLLNGLSGYPRSEKLLGEEEDDSVTTPKITPFQSYIAQAAEAYQVDPALIKAIIKAESSYDHMAVSERGAQGLMQLMPTTAKWLGVDNSFDPELNIDAGVRYIKYLLDRFDGNVQLALAAYNAGPVYVRKYNGVPPFDATRAYIKKVLRYQRIYKQEMAAQESSNSAV